MMKRITPGGWFWLLYLGMLTVFTAAMCAPTLAHAQTKKAVTLSDSLLLIAKASGTAFDTARVEWQYNGQSFARLLKPNATDTVRAKRATSIAARTDSAILLYSKYTTTRSAIAIAAFVVPAPPVVSPPVVTPPPVVQPPVALPPPIAQPTAHAWADPIAPATFSVAYPLITGATRRVAAGADLQAVLNAAQSGDEIVLADGATFTGNFVLPARACTGWVVIRNETVGPVGVRRDSTTSAIVRTTNSEPAIRTANSACKVRMVGFIVEHNATNATQNYGIVVLGVGNEPSVSLIPSDIVLDRMWVRSTSTGNTSRCVAMNGIREAVIDSRLTDCHGKGFDSQGIGGWSGPGPYLIDNNRIEGSTQAIMFGGADPVIVGQQPADITITRNYLYKPLSWGRGLWTVKAAFELKNAKRVRFEGNVIENHWADGQTGFAIVLQTLADNNRSWQWTTVADVLIANNLIKNATSGINILGRVAYNGGALPTNPTTRVSVVNNLWQDVGRDPFAGNYASMSAQVLSATQDVTIANNTFTLAQGSQGKALSFDGVPNIRTTVTDNIFPASNYGIGGNGTTPLQTLSVFTPGIVFLRNNIPGLSASVFPANALNNAAGADTVAVNKAVAGVVR